MKKCSMVQHVLKIITINSMSRPLLLKICFTFPAEASFHQMKHIFCGKMMTDYSWSSFSQQIRESAMWWDSQPLLWIWIRFAPVIVRHLPKPVVVYWHVSSGSWCNHVFCVLGIEVHFYKCLIRSRRTTRDSYRAEVMLHVVII